MWFSHAPSVFLNPTVQATVINTTSIGHFSIALPGREILIYNTFS
nr:hypothetical protein [Pontibacter sp. 172403-2]